MKHGYPFSGTGNLYRFTQGLVSIGVLNNTIIVYDNDAEGIAKLEKTKALSLPFNLRVMQLPPLEEFSEFKTEGPTGISSEDINGRAAAIECYLDLNRKKLPEPIIRWTSYNHEAGVYQGELDKKTAYMKDFLSLRNNENYDAEKLEKVLDAIMKECVSIAERKLIDTHSKKL